MACIQVHYIEKDFNGNWEQPKPMLIQLLQEVNVDVKQ
jgi:hypothetical protein